jgi:hypothetical protein
VPDAALKPALLKALREHEIGAASPYVISFAGNGHSGASFGFMQGDMAVQSLARDTFARALTAAGVPQAKLDALLALLKGPQPHDPLSPADEALINDALAREKSFVDAMDLQILQGVFASLDGCVAVAASTGRTIAPKSQLYMAMWINMTGTPTTMRRWLGGQAITVGGPPAFLGTVSKTVAAPGSTVDAATMEAYMAAMPYYQLHPHNLATLKQCAADGMTAYHPVSA